VSQFLEQFTALLARRKMETATATNDYLLSAVCGPAGGYGLKSNATGGLRIGRGLLLYATIRLHIATLPIRDENHGYFTVFHYT
jgi:hypothetical protein